MKLSEMSDREILVHLVYRVRGIEKRLDNHLRHVWALAMGLLAIAGAAVVALLIK
jgi:hypothetical protein